jgi:hypothetical protein
MLTNDTRGGATVHRFSRNDAVQFGFGLPADVNEQLQKAASSITNGPESLEALCMAHVMAPQQLEVLVALYKFHFYQGALDQAEDYVFQALIKSAQAGGFKYDWERLTPESTDWNDVRGPGRVYLYSLKALAFIRLRQDNPAHAENILDTLRRLDPEDKVGANVIRDLLHAMKENDDE